VERWSFKEKLLLRIVPRCFYWALRLLAMTIRKEVFFSERPQRFWDEGQHIIAAFWHQRLLMMPFASPGWRPCVLISQHRDGEFIARAVKVFGVDSIRGSTTRGGFSALREMIRVFRKGSDIAITPDGPQGPKHVVQGGILQLARETGAPILPLTYSASRKKIFQSWDQFIFPLPFSKVVYMWGEPLFVPRDIEKERLEEKRLLLQERLKQITEETDRLFKKKP